MKLQTPCYLNRAFAMIKVGDNRGALRDIHSVLQNDPKNAKALYRKAQALRALGTIDDALTVIREANKYAQGIHIILFYRNTL